MLVLLGSGVRLNSVAFIVFLAVMTLSVVVGFLPRVKKSAAEAGEAVATNEVGFLGAIVFLFFLLTLTLLLLFIVCLCLRRVVLVFWV